MADDWPLSRNKLNASDFNQVARQNTIRTKIDAGIDKLRRRYTTPIIHVTGSMIITHDEYVVLENFYNIIIAGGVDSFNFPDPATDIPYEHRFIDPPTYTSLGGPYYKVSLKLERI